MACLPVGETAMSPCTCDHCHAHAVERLERALRQAQREIRTLREENAILRQTLIEARVTIGEMASCRRLPTVPIQNSK